MGKYETFVNIWEYDDPNGEVPLCPAGRVLDKAIETIQQSILCVSVELDENISWDIDVEDVNIRVTIADTYLATPERLDLLDKLIVFDANNPAAGLDGKTFWMPTCVNGKYTGGRDEYQMSCRGLEII